jgi:hypothetical protein
MDFPEAMDCDLFAHRKVRDSEPALANTRDQHTRRVPYPETTHVFIEHGDSDFCLT